jgi:hypothetical protein
VVTDRNGARKKNQGGQIKKFILKGVKILMERLEKIFLAGAQPPPASATGYGGDQFHVL